MIALLWALGACGVVGAAVHIPFLLGEQMAKLKKAWAPQLKKARELEANAEQAVAVKPTARSLSFRYALAGLRLRATAATFALYCVSWLVMAGIYSGFLQWAAEVASR